MSGPMAASFGIEAAVLASAGAIVDGIGEIAAGLAEADRQATETATHRQAERQQMREARQAGLEKRRQNDAARAARLRRWQTLLAAPAPTRHVETSLADLVAAGEAAQSQLATYLASVPQSETADASRAARQALIASAIEALELAPDESLPADFEQPVADIAAAPTQARAMALIIELRRQVQNFNDERKAAATEARLRAAAALVLEQSLRDLGYAVDDIGETLFIEGGVAHFQRHEWGDYFVRLRIDPQRGMMNFNVVRARTANSDRHQEDRMAEERWCADFPHLFETLKARGIPIQVTRLLQAGEAPVQIVDAASLPECPHEAYRQEPLKARGLP